MMQSVAQIDPFWMHKACDSLFGREEGIYGFLHVGHSKGTCIVQSQATGAFDGGRFKFQATSTTESTDATTSDILAKADPTNDPTKLMRSPFSQDTCTRERGPPQPRQGETHPTIGNCQHTTAGNFWKLVRILLVCKDSQWLFNNTIGFTTRCWVQRSQKQASF